LLVDRNNDRNWYDYVPSNKLQPTDQCNDGVTHPILWGSTPNEVVGEEHQQRDGVVGGTPKTVVE